MKKMKNIIIYIIVCIVIFASFKIPEMLFEIVYENMEMKVYEKKKDESTIDIEAEKIYLVKAIHDIEKEENKVAITASETTGKYTVVESGNIGNSSEIFKELLKLKEYNILDGPEINEGSDCKIGLIYRSYQNNENKYMINNISLGVNDKEYQLQMENKTGKILCIFFEKENLYSNYYKEEIMKNYIKYLDLYIIDDWKFADNMLKSEKAKLVVNLVANEDHYILSIHSTERIFNKYLE